MATRGAITIALVLVVEWWFASATGTLDLPARPGMSRAQLAALDLQHHDALVIAMLLGGVVALNAAVSVNDPTIGRQSITLVYMGVITSTALTLGLWIGPHRVPALVGMVVVLVIGALARRFGPRGSISSLPVFLGYFFGYFLSSEVRLDQGGWLVAEIWLAVAVAAVVRTLIFRPEPDRAVRRAIRSYRARSQEIFLLAVELFEAPSERARRKLRRRLIRLNEAALIVEGQLGEGERQGDSLALHQRLFDTELALTNVARFVEAFASMKLSSRHRQAVRRALEELAAGRPGQAIGVAGDLAGSITEDEPANPTERVILHRFARSVEALGTLLATPGASTAGAEDDAEPSHGGGSAAFRPAVALQAGWLPGSAGVSAEASVLGRSGGSNRLALPPYGRAAVQTAVAVTIAIVAGSAIDPQRFYWAVIAAVLALAGTNTSVEQVRKAVFRVIGTVVGVVVGTGFVDAVGHHSVWSVVVVVVSLFLGLYLVRINYAFMAMAITVALSQAYLSLGEFSHGPLLNRLAETAVGAGAAILTVVVVVPLPTRRVVGVAAADLVDALASVADRGARRLEGDEDSDDLRAWGRQIDAAFQALDATARPLHPGGWTDQDQQVARLLAAAAAARNYGRNLVFDAVHVSAPCRAVGRVREARTLLASSAAVLAARLRGERPAKPYVRSASIFDELERSLRRPDSSPSAAVLTLRDLELLDGALAMAAEAVGHPVTDLDTAAVGVAE
ncbi:MAG TPA: FUSC family protein [Acidimicrobiales bacterium]|nr:FUSC family protein [Acidimicrobiales bacterium]